MTTQRLIYGYEDTEFQKYISHTIRRTGKVVVVLKWPIAALKPSSSTVEEMHSPEATRKREHLEVKDFEDTGINIEKDRKNGKVDAVYMEL